MQYFVKFAFFIYDANTVPNLKCDNWLKLDFLFIVFSHFEKIFLKMRKPKYE